jgi:hypothetical protein
MAQHDYTIANQGFPATRADINNALSAIATNNSGTSAPSTQYAGQFWIDTTASTWTLYIHDGTDDIQFATIDTSANTVNFIDSALDVVTDTTPQLGGNLDVNGNSIVSTSNANITLAPNGTGDVILSADTVKIGDVNVNATITTDGTGDLILNTNSGSSSGSITIADGANNNINITPNGTGKVIMPDVTITNLTATEITTSRINIGANLGWNSSSDAYTANTTPSKITSIHQNMKRCLLNTDGTINYFLNPSDSTQKLDGSASTLDGSDGNVMVQIPKFYFKYVKNGTTHNYNISDLPLAGYQLHPAFFKNGEIVDYRYIGAYDACFLDATDSTFKSGTNLADMTANIDTANDLLASVSGIYPLVGVTRAEARSLASNVGTGWRQVDFWLISAIQMLYLVEYGTFNSQSVLGNGNTGLASYPASSANQTDSPHSIAGKSNSLGNASTDSTSGASSASRDTAFMSYRGIENFYGNCYNWVDGYNIGIVAARDNFVSNNDAHFADNTSTNYIKIGTTNPTANGFVSNIQDIAGAFIPSSSTGGSSSTFITDNYFQSTGNRVARFGGLATDGSLAGAFLWNLGDSSSFSSRNGGCRLSF